MQRVTGVVANYRNFRHFPLFLFFCFPILVPAGASALENTSFLPSVFELLIAEKNPNLSMSRSVVAPAATITINFANLPGNNGDWIGIFQPNAESNWDNVVRWLYTNGTTSMDFPGPASGSLAFTALPEGSYEARLFFNNNYEVVDSLFFRVGEVIGPRNVASTPLIQGTLFAAPNGAGQACTKENPCAIQTAFGRLEAGAVLFLRGGIYHWLGRVDVKASGTENQPIIIESYPGELAILDGNRLTPEEIMDNPIPGIWVYTGKNYIHIRKLEVKNMGGAGINLQSSNNVIEGCIIHHNHYNGIHIVDGNWDWGSHEPFTNGYNRISDNIIYDNSDVGLNSAPFNDGGNSDGISISYSTGNTIVHNMVYNNSDDGIDTYCSNNAYIAYNITHENGLGVNGNGNGFKTGCGRQPGVIGINAVVERNISYYNRHRDFNYNLGTGQTFRYNTAYIRANAIYANGETGFTTGQDTIVEYNIASGEDFQSNTVIQDGHHNNSWQMQGDVEFISSNPASSQFLRPAYGSPFEGLGVYGH